jgi:two-component sensor histidine kinase
MSLIHQLLYEHGDLERIRLGTYIERLIALLRETYSARRNSVDVRFTSIDVDIYLDIGRAIPCGLIVTELVTNSFKHAFPQDRRGTIIVSLQADPEAGAVLVVRDDGIGIPESVALGEGTSLGFRLLPSLAEQLGGYIVLVRYEGSRCELHFPV